VDLSQASARSAASFRVVEAERNSTSIRSRSSGFGTALTKGQNSHCEARF
jgi:hypothetical protein